MMSAIAGVNQALWDIKGKFHGAPVYDLLGGKVRDKVQIYAGIGGDRPADVARQAQQRKDDGLKAIKMGAVNEVHYMDTFAHIDAAVARVASVREQVGNDFSIAVDFHGRVHKPMAKMLIRELEPYHLMFVEEPILPMHNESLLDIKRSTSIPIATGERMYSRVGFQDDSCGGAASILYSPMYRTPAASRKSYGLRPWRKPTMWRWRRIAHWDRSRWLLACKWMQWLTRPDSRAELGHTLQHRGRSAGLSGGSIGLRLSRRICQCADCAGLGIEIDEGKVRAASDHNFRWRNPRWRRQDGSVAEW